MASYFNWLGGSSGGQLQSAGMLTKEQLLQLFREFSNVLALPGEGVLWGFLSGAYRCWFHICGGLYCVS